MYDASPVTGPGSHSCVCDPCMMKAQLLGQGECVLKMVSGSQCFM